MRYIRLEQGLVLFKAILPNKLVFCWNQEAWECIKRLEDLLNTLVDRRDGYYSVCLNMRKCQIEFEFHEGDA